MASAAELALAELRTHVGETGSLPGAFSRRVRRAAEMLEMAARADGHAGDALATAILQLMRALGAVEEPAQENGAVMAVRRALELLKEVRDPAAVGVTAPRERTSGDLPAYDAFVGGTRQAAVLDVKTLAPRFDLALPSSVPVIAPAPPPPVIAPVPPSPPAALPDPTPPSEKGAATAAGVRAVLAALHARRRRLLADLGARGQDLARIDERITAKMRAAEWVDADAAVGLDADEAFAAALMALLRPEAAGRAARLEAAPAALWFTPPGRVPEVVAKALRMDGLKTWGARLALAHGLSLPPMTGWLDDPSDDTAAAAAQLIAANPSSEGLRAIVDRLPASMSPARRHAFMASAALMGHAPALEEIRRRLQDGDVAEAFVHALVQVGEERDAELLAHAAAHGGPLGHLAALACGHLGSARAVLSLPAALDDSVREQALVLVFGDGARASRPGRLSRGELWCVSRARAQARDPQEWLVPRVWCAWELRTRLGSTGPVCDVSASSALQAGAAERLPARPDEHAGEWLAPPWR